MNEPLFILRTERGGTRRLFADVARLGVDRPRGCPPAAPAGRRAGLVGIARYAKLALARLRPARS